jgi:hypothetical protein
MDANQVISEIVQSHSDPCGLDKIYLPYARANAGPAAKFGLGCELYLPNIDRSTLREQALQFLLDYQQLFPLQVDEFLPRDQRRTLKLKGDLGSRVRDQCSKYASDTGYSTSLFGAVDTGVPKDDVAPYQAHVLVKRARYDELSFVSANMPVCNETGRLNFDVLVDAVLRWCSICRPMHGTAGFALTFASGMQQNTKYALSIMKRFPGFEYVDGVDFTREVAAAHDRIKCVNWLTVLCDSIVTELGGIETMRAGLQSMCSFHEYPGGVVIQAGETPQLGDTYRADIPEAYRMVARYTRAVRFEAYSDLLFRVPDGADHIEETLSWVRRFD